MVVTTVINGEDSFFSFVSLDDRLGPAMSAQGYQPLSIVVDRGFAIFGIPYRATVQFETAGQPATLPALLSGVTKAATEATGYAPATVSFPSFGQVTAPPPANPVGDLFDNAADILGVTRDAAKIIVIGAGIAAAVVLYQIAKNPRLLR